jgi:iron(III) transport system ATP-binding protein
MSGEMPRLALEGISCVFGNYTAVDRLNLAIAPGEFVSLLGPSGCGKTTTLRMIAGFVQPTAGSIRLDGTVVSAPGTALPPERRGMSMIFQSYAIWPNMTVAENVAFGLKLRHMARAEREARVRQMLAVVKLAHLADRYPAELSGGQQQRVALARAIVIEPRVLLLDEPLSNLDASLREEMRFEIRRLHDQFRFTTVYVTHDQSEAMVTSDRIAVMNAGRIEQVAAPFDIYCHPQTRFVARFIGRTNLLEAICDGGRVRFDGFDLPQSLFRPEVAGMGPLTFSVRPQSIGLHRTAPAEAACAVRAVLTERAFLGESWDYTARPEGGGQALKVSTAPAEVFEAAEQVWLRFDPAQMALVRGEA